MELISRQAAIDALRKMQTYKMFSGDDMLLIDQAGAQTELMLLPSAQPEIMRCKDCKYYIDHKCYENKHILTGLFVHDEDYCRWAGRREVTE